MAEDMRNLHMYSGYVFFSNLFFWTPVFFLVFSEHLTLQEIMLLEGIYYFSVVLIELPTGYASDRLGRKQMLVLSAASAVLAYSLFALADSFWTFAAAQVAFALSISCNSGSDTSWHHDTLKAMDRESEFMERESLIVRLMLIAPAIGGVGGGLIASVELQFAYAASAAAAGFALLCALTLREPPHTLSEESPTQQLKHVWRTLNSDGRLRWMGLAYTTLVILNHLPYEFFQPYLKRAVDLPVATSIVTGAHTTLALLIAAFMAGHTANLTKRFGSPTIIMLAHALVLVLLTAMMWTFHPVVAVLLLLRSMPRGLATAPLNAEVAEHVESSIKATLFSTLSLAGRLGFGVVLLGLSLVAGWDDSSGLTAVLGASAAISGLLVASLWLTRPRT